MKSPCLKVLVYRTLYPHPVDGDPTIFSEFVNKYIVPEVRTETMRFYGPIDDLEAKYPGLDYASPAHRLRLRQFPNHCRLFDAFDRLGLTYWEIYELCKWEGTKNAKDKYMKHNNVIINDTTWDGIRPDNRPRLQPTSYRSLHHRPQYQELQLDGACDGRTGSDGYYSAEEDAIGRRRTSLNQRVRAATAAHLRGQTLSLDPAYEQWLKEARERGTTIHSTEFPPPLPATPTSPFSPHRRRSRTLAPILSSEYQPPTSNFRYLRRRYDGSDWGTPYPDVTQYGSAAPRPQTSTFPYVIESARRMMAAPPPTPASTTDGTRMPSLVGPAPSETRRSRRR